MSGISESIQVIFGPTEDFIYINGYQSETTDPGDFYDEIVSLFSIISCKENKQIDYSYDIELQFRPTGDVFNIKEYLTFEESETAIHEEVRHFLEVNGFHRHNASWNTLEN
jgi:hypothetical protein